MKNSFRWLAALLLFGGCFNPDISHVTYECDFAMASTPGICPDGQQCVRPGNCVPIGPDDAGVVADAASPDLAPPSGCAAGGGRLFRTVWGCPGAFAKGAAKTACRAGYHVATDQTGLDLAACLADPTTFYIADELGFATGNGCFQHSAGGVLCNMFTTTLTHFRYGCGKGVSDVVTNCFNTCGGFNAAITCEPSPPVLRYHCSSSTALDDESNDEPTLVGVLCAPG